MIRLVLLQKVEPTVDLADQPDLVGQDVEGTDAAAVYRASALGHLVLDVARGQHRAGLVVVLLPLEPLGQFPLAPAQDSVILGVHSKCPSWVELLLPATRILPNRNGHFESFIGPEAPQLRLNRG